MSECPNCGKQVEDDTINICPHCKFSFEYDEDVESVIKKKWVILAILIFILVFATPFLTIFFRFP